MRIRPELEPVYSITIGTRSRLFDYNREYSPSIRLQPGLDPVYSITTGNRARLFDYIEVDRD